MAINSISAASSTQWQLISSVTPTNGATGVTFSSIAGYKTLMLVAQSIVPSAGEVPYLQFNGETTSGNYYANFNGIPTGSSQTAANGRMAIIYDANLSIPHRVDAVTTATSGTLAFNFWGQPTPITSVFFGFIGGATFTAAGTVALYGIAA